MLHGKMFDAFDFHYLFSRLSILRGSCFDCWQSSFCYRFSIYRSCLCGYICLLVLYVVILCFFFRFFMFVSCFVSAFWIGGLLKNCWTWERIEFVVLMEFVVFFGLVSFIFGFYCFLLMVFTFAQWRCILVGLCLVKSLFCSPLFLEFQNHKGWEFIKVSSWQAMFT